MLFVYYYVPWYMTKWCSERWCHLPKVIELVIDTPGDVKSGLSTSQTCGLSRHSAANYKQRPHSWSLLPACSATSTCCSGTSSSVVSPAPPWSIIGRWYSSISSSPPCLPLSSESSIKMSLQKHSWRCLSYIRVAKTPRWGAAASMGVALGCPEADSPSSCRTEIVSGWKSGTSHSSLASCVTLGDSSLFHPCC